MPRSLRTMFDPARPRKVPVSQRAIPPNVLPRAMELPRIRPHRSMIVGRRKPVCGDMLAQITSGAVLGVDAYLVRVEVDLGRGLPCINVVGLAESAVREGRERVLAAMANEGFTVPPRRITINLAPADIPKSGSAFDLPLAVGILAATDGLSPTRLAQACLVGELGLDGSVRPVRGVLPIAARCRADGVRALLCPPANAAEAAVIDGLEVVPVPTLGAAIDHLTGRLRLPPEASAAPQPVTHSFADLDFADVKGQESAKRALEVAAAGSHNTLMRGPPGAGKSMLARRLAGILPPLSQAEAIEVTKIYSVAGALRPGQALVRVRPFRAPHHTVSDAGLVGGGNPPRPGEASLAHTGVLFLDELPEFRRNALESLRQPMEDWSILIGRARLSLQYPARFMLVAAMNPCPCGFHGTGTGRCVCTPVQVERYTARMSGPLLDRIDIHVEVPAVDGARLSDARAGESSDAIRARVAEARGRQQARFATDGVRANAHMSARELREHCAIDADGERLLRNAVQRLGLSARAFHRILRVARTIADLAGSTRIGTPHLAEAVQYRTLDRPAVRG
jgi:magnesium chelatase family protein